MEQKTPHREIWAILVSILFLVLGFLAVWLAKRLLEFEGDAIFVTLILVPIIVYLIFSGRLTELKGPGGLEAKFVGIAEQSVELVSETIGPSVGDMEVVAKGGAGALQRQIYRLDESKPIILTLTLGREGYYKDVWIRYMEALSQYRTFKFVVILDHENKFVAYIPSGTMLQILRMEALGDEFVRIINDGNIGELRRYPGVVTRTISTDSTNVDALREMTAQNLEALVVIDKDRNLKGVVEREQLISKMLLGILR